MMENTRRWNWLLRWRMLHDFLPIATHRPISPPRRTLLTLEVLEDRTLLAAPPQYSWALLGPSPQQDPNSLLDVGAGVIGSKADVSGRVSALAYSKDIGGGTHALFLGSASGGVWRTTSFAAGTENLMNNPIWVQVSDALFTGKNGAGTPVSPADAPGAPDTGSLAVDPNNPKIIYDGTGEANYSADSRYGSGILKSTDGGNNWFVVSDFSKNHSISKIIVDPTVNKGEAATLYAAVVPSAKNEPDNVCGIWKSVNGGIDWTKFQVIAPPMADPSIAVTDLAYALVKPMVGNQQFWLYAGIGNARKYGSVDNANNGIWLSKDGGTTWKLLADPAIPSQNTIGRISLSVNPGTGMASPLVYAAISKSVGTGETGGLLSVLRSDNNGTTWKDITPTGLQLAAYGAQAGYYQSLAVDPANPQSVYLGGMRSFRSTDGGTTWVQLDKPAVPTSRPHVDQHAWAFAGNSVFDGTDGGIWKYVPARNAAGVWTDLNTAGLATIQANSVTTNNDATNPVYLIASQDNGTARWKGGAANSWQTVGGSDGIMVRIDKSGTVGYRTIVSSANSDVIWMTPGPIGAGLLGDSWDTIPKNANGDFFPGSKFAFNTVFAISPSNPRHLVIAAKGKVWEAFPLKDRPNLPVWYDASGKYLAGQTITALTFMDDKIVYAGTDNGSLFRTWDITQQNPVWVQLAFPIPVWPLNKLTPITSLVPIQLAGNTSRLLITQGNPTSSSKVVSLTDVPASGGLPGRLSWQNLTGTGLPNVAVNSIVADPNDTTAYPLYVATDVGVYYSVKVPGSDRVWSRFGTGLPNVQVKDLQLYAPPSKPPKLVAATYGRGVYQVNMLPPKVKIGIEGAANPVVLGSFADTTGTGPYSVSVNWGDGSAQDTTSGSVTTSGTTNTVQGTHSYPEAGDYTITASVTSGSNTQSFTYLGSVSEADLTASSTTIVSSVGSPLSGTLVGTFTDANALATSGADFTATIDWGDSTTSPGTITYASGTFDVAGSHLYSNAGSFSVATTIDDAEGSSTTITSPATISGTVSATALPLTAMEGTPTGPVPVATFTATDAGPFTASINWGDGNTSAGTVTALAGVYTITGGNTFGLAGTFPVTVTIIDNGVPAAAVTGTATVTITPLMGMGLPIVAAQGVALANVTVARFTDPNPGANLSGYTATIDFGDGVPSDDGSSSVVTGAIFTEGGGTFAVTGSYVYLQSGTYPVTVSVDGPDGPLSVSTTATVTGSVPQVTAVSPSWGPPQGGTVVTLSGTNLLGATAVRFGTSAATGFTVNADGSITAIEPALSVGTVDITVTTPYGTSVTSSADLFTAVSGSAPTVTGLGSLSGPTGGGNVLTITGTDLASATLVRFGSIVASFTVNSNTSILATVPAQLSGTVDVTVTTPYGTSATGTADQYTYNGTLPAVTGLDRIVGPALGGVLLTVSGSNFNGATSVSFGSVATTNFTVFNSTSLGVLTPALAGGNYHVTVSTPYGTSTTSPADQFTAIPAPVVSGLANSSGPTGGGTSVIVTGSGFTGALAVLFGNQWAAFTVNSDTSLTATLPAYALAGTVDVTVVTAGGTSALVSADQFTYNATSPSVSAVGPPVGPTAGNTQVTITGANLNGTTAVLFGGTATTSFTVVSPTQITAVTPPGAVGGAHVTVTTAFGTSSPSSADLYTYADMPAPQVTSLGTPSGPMSGATSVTISGSGFTASQRVLFGYVAAPSFVVNSDTSITAIAPTQGAAVVDVTIKTPYGTSRIVPVDRYTYLAAAPSISGLGTTTGPGSGGTAVTISGANLTSTAQVRFGGVLASFTVASDSSITAISPVAATGTVDITVVTPWGMSATGTQDHFSFTASGAPSVTGLGLYSGPTGGGTTVTITGTGFTSATNVTFGSANANAFTINSDTSITAIAPPGVAGMVDVTVTAAVGISAISSADHFTYNASAPAIIGVTPASAAAVGGAQVTITGTNFNGASGVKFGGTPAASFIVNSPVSITAFVPALVAGSYHVTVTTPTGTSATSSNDLLQAVSGPAPVVTSLNIFSGSTGGGSSVVLTGTGFTGATLVLFGSTAASYIVNSDSQITALAPAQAAGAINVTVQTPGGASPPNAGNGFTYLAPVPAISGLGTISGPTAGGTAVIVSGSGFTGASSVSFGGTAALLFNVNSDTSLTAWSPLNTAGTVDITVTTGGGTSGTGSADRFTFTTTATTTPTVSGLSVASGPSSGGTSVTISGTNLAGTTGVRFGSLPASSFNLLSPTSISAIAPPQAAGSMSDITVTTPMGISATTVNDHFSYLTAMPSITGVSPASGNTAGGNIVTLTGMNFIGTRSVTFGAYTASSFTVISNTSLLAVVPLAAPGAVDVEVSNADGISATSSADLYTFAASANAPTLTAVSPSGGPTGGGTSVSITGTNFSNVGSVSFGGVPAMAFTVNSVTSITALAPAAASGTVDVRVGTNAGISASSSADLFLYTATAPVVSSLNVNSGPTAGGTLVTITGANLNGLTGVSFGGMAATSFTAMSATQIIATAPVGSVGAVHLIITTPYGTSASSSADLFSYIAAPTVSGLSVPSGTTAGGTSVTITGSNFTGLVSVSFGGLPAATLTVNSPTSITATTPASIPDPVDVTVSTPLGTSLISAADQFTYVAAPKVTAVNPFIGPASGVTTVTITGANLTGATAVKFGMIAATSFTVVSDTQITAISPVEAAGIVDITVTTVGGTSTASAADQFTYVAAPTITAISPSSGPATGGTTVTITGTNLSGATTVNFGTFAAASFTVNSGTQITATSPAGMAATVDITVITAGGTSTATAADQFTFNTTPQGTITTDMPLFAWVPVSGATSYVLYVVDNNTGQSPVLLVSNLMGTSDQLTPAQALTPGHAFTWYLGAVTNGTTTYGSGTNFSITPLVGPPQGNPTGIISAATGYDLPTFTWTADPGANHYNVVVVDTTLNSTVINSPAGSGTSWTATTALTPGHTFTWYVGAVSTNGLVTTYLPNGQSFSLAALAGPPQGNPTGTISAATSYDLPTFTWTAVTGANHYNVVVVDTTLNSTVINSAAGTGTSWTATTALTPGHTFIWYVGAVSTNGLATTYLPNGQSFTLAALLGPPQGNPTGTILAATGYDFPTFTWATVAGANHYNIVVVDTSINSTVINSPAGSGTSWTATTALTPGHTFIWYVGAVSTNGLATTYLPNGQSFTLAALAGPPLGTPTGTILASTGYDFPTFTWATVAGANHYNVVVVDTSINSTVINSPAGSGTSWTATTALTPGHTFIWYVGAVSTNGLATTYLPNGQSFTLAALAGPPLGTPTGTILASTGYDFPTFTWATVAGANHYGVYVLDTVTNIGINNPNVGSGTSWTENTPLTPGHTFTWYVTAYSTNGLGSSYLPNGQSFTLAALAAPSQVSPTGIISAAAGYDYPTFTWNTVIGANHYGVYVLDTTTNIGINNPNVGSGTSWTETTALTPGHTFTWYVSAVSTNSLGSSYLPNGQAFTLASLAAPTLTSPSGTISAATGYDYPTFTWTAVPGAYHYNLYVVDTVTGLAVINIANVGSLTSWTSPIALTPGDSYTWYVAAFSTNGLANSYLPGGQSFTLAALAAPALLSPTGNIPAGTGYNYPIFNWGAVAGAYHYNLYVVDTVTGQPVINIANVGAVTSWTSSVALTPGDSFTWYVAAFSTNGLASSYLLSGQSFTLAELVPPTVTALSTTSGSNSGGNSITITGTNFRLAGSVYFGGSPADFTVISGTSILATVPAYYTSGPVSVSVTTSAGTSALTSADLYTYTTAPPPTVTAISPTTGSTAGGTVVGITGTLFTSTAGVYFGNIPATNVVFHSATSLTATAPANSAGTMDVTVSTSSGSSTTSSADQFNYTGAGSTATWIASNGDWSTASSWSTGLLPTASTDAFIPAGITVTHSSSNTDAVHQLTVNGTLSVSNGTLNVNATSSIANLTISGGTFGANSPVTVTNKLNWTSGTLQANGTVTIAATATALLGVSGSSGILSSGTLVNLGSATFGFGSLWFVSATIDNSAGATFTSAGTAFARNLYGMANGTFLNEGTFNQTGSYSTTFASSMTFTNSGTVNVTAGTLSVAAGTNSGTVTVSSGANFTVAGMYTLASSSTINGSGSMTIASGTMTLGGSITPSGGVTINSGATVSGAGTIASNVTNNGGLLVGGSSAIGTVTINGNFTQGSSGYLSMEIASSMTFDRLSISGTASLGGSLTVSQLNSYIPSNGTSFSLLTYAFHSGTFSSVMTSLPTKQYNATNFTLVARADIDAPLEELPEDDAPPRREKMSLPVDVPHQDPAAPVFLAERVLAGDLFFSDRRAWGEDAMEPTFADPESSPEFALGELALLPIDFPLAMLDAIFEALG